MMHVVSPNTVYRLKVAAATATAGTALALLISRACEPLCEPHKPVPGPAEPERKPQPDCGPRRGDSRCETAKGEADPLSPNFDPESCGYCGDEIRQVLAQSGGKPYLEPETGIMYQNVTERPSESAETCPVDFHCGDRRLQSRHAYGAWVEFPVGNGDAGPQSVAYRLGVKIVTETRGSCPRDYLPSNGNRDAGASEEDAGPEPAPPQHNSNFYCPSLMAPTRNEMANLHSASVWSVISRVNGSIIGHASDIRNALSLMDPDAKVDVRVMLRVAPSGLVYLESMSATCDSQPCGNQLALLNASQISLDGLLMGSPGTDCYWIMNVRVP